MSTAEFSFTSSYGGNVLHFPVTDTIDGRQIQPPLEAVTADQTIASTEQAQASGIVDTLLQPDIYVPAALAVSGAIVAVGAAKISRLKSARAERAADRQLAEEIAMLPDERTLSHRATTLVLDSLFADVQILEKSEDGCIEVHVEGQHKRVRQMNLQAAGDALVVSAPPEKRMDREFLDDITSPAIQRIVKWIAKRGRYKWVDDTDKLSITAAVPPGTRLESRDVEGETVAHVKLGDVEIQTAYGSTVGLYAIDSADITTEEDSGVVISFLYGDINVKAGYKSEVKVTDGHVANASAQLEEDATFTLGTSTGSLSLKGGYNSRGSVKGDVLHASVDLEDGARLRVNGTIASGKVHVGYGATVSAHEYGPDVKRVREEGGHIRTHRPRRRN